MFPCLICNFVVTFTVHTDAALLLTQGYGPGETARMLGYGSLAWFSRRFHALTGQTPGAYRRAPHPLHLCER